MKSSEQISPKPAPTYPEVYTVAHKSLNNHNNTVHIVFKKFQSAVPLVLSALQTWQIGVVPSYKRGDNLGGDELAHIT